MAIGPGFFIFFTPFVEVDVSCLIYVTLAEADAINAGDPTWTGATDPDKQAAIDIGYKYLKANYTCSYDCEVDTVVPDSLKLANSMLALVHLTTPLSNSAPSVSRVKSKSFGADGVSHSRNYGTANKVVTDPHADVTLELEGTCRLKIDKAVNAGVVIRG